MTVDDARRARSRMVYSGETYNFTELRAELAARGHRFATESDTEVVLHGYLEWGEAVAERLNGMYAFAIWDGRTEQLVMVRDRMGIKPLLLLPDPRRRAVRLRAQGDPGQSAGRRAVRLDGLRELFAFVKTPGHAVWDGMREVEPGTVVTVDARGLRSHAYWTLQTREHTDDRDATVAQVRELLDDIVRRQLVADVPRCMLLSGGLDSSALTALAARPAGRSAARRSAASPSTSSARPRTSCPTICAAPRTPPSCTRSPSTPAPTTRTSCSTRTRSPTPRSARR